MSHPCALPAPRPSRLLLLLAPCMLLCTYGGKPPSALPDAAVSDTTIADVAPFPLGQARALTLSDSWSGLSRRAPLGVDYTMHRAAEAFEGSGRFYVAPYSNHPREAEEPIAIPLDAAARFLEMLAQTSVRAGPYEPKITYTDSYPRIRIEIVAEADTVAIFSRSQGEDRTPWGATIRGRSYVIDAATPTEAVEIIGPFLKRDTLKKLLDKG